MRLLVVEDDPRLAAVLTRGLRENGYAVDRAADGGGALEHLHNNAYDAVPLTSKEYALLEYLARNAGRVVGREEIAEHVWDERYDPFSNVIDVYVNRLRKKVGPELIVTRRSEGYMLRP